jgi:hypothetical protein
MIPCSKEADIAEIKTELKDLNKIVKGNGKPGLHDDVITIKGELPTIRESIKEMGENFENSIEEMSEGFETSLGELSGKVQLLLDKKIVDDTERNLKLSAKQKLAVIITTVIAFAGVALFAIDMILKNKAG